MSELPTIAGGFGAILADPPWRMKMYSVKGMGRSPDGPMTRAESRTNNPARHYSTLSIDEIKSLPVGHVAARDCVLFLWAIDPLLPAAIEVGRHWGFEFKTVAFVWAKLRRETSTRGMQFNAWEHQMFPIGTGYWTRANPELCLLFTRGRPKRISASVRKLVVAPRREHSRKPDRIASDVEALCGGPYLELFARQSRPGWATWGNEATKFDTCASTDTSASTSNSRCGRAASPTRDSAGLTGNGPSLVNSIAEIAAVQSGEL